MISTAIREDVERALRLSNDLYGVEITTLYDLLDMMEILEQYPPSLFRVNTFSELHKILSNKEIERIGYIQNIIDLHRF